MAGRRTPASRGNSTTHTDEPSVADLLENKLEQLQSLLWCCYGDGNRWFEDAGPKHLDNVLWIAADLASEAAELFQQCERDGAHKPDTRRPPGRA